MDCLFCKFASKEIPVDPVFENDRYFVLNDIHPKAKTHMLIIPKEHVSTISDLSDSQETLVGGMFLLARDLAKERGISGYKLQFNVGADGGQEIMHIHLHFLSNS